MEVEFRDKTLALVETDRAPETRLGLALINSLRDKLIFLKSAPDERSLRNWKSLHYEKMEGDERSIRINKQFRLIFTIDTASQPNKITVLRVWNHD
jgi:proteic killer suppression protein